MKPLPDGVKLRKVETPKHLHRVTASYAVLLNGTVVGRVHRFVEPTGKQAAWRYGPTPTVAVWGWDRPDVPEDPCGYDRRSDAIDWLMRSLDVPRET